MTTLHSNVWPPHDSLTVSPTTGQNFPSSFLTVIKSHCDEQPYVSSVNLFVHVSLGKSPTWYSDTFLFCFFLLVNNVGMLPNLLPSHFLNAPDEIQVDLCSSAYTFLLPRFWVPWLGNESGPERTDGSVHPAEILDCVYSGPLFSSPEHLIHSQQYHFSWYLWDMDIFLLLCTSKLTCPLSHSFGVLHSTL